LSLCVISCKKDRRPAGGQRATDLAAPLPFSGRPGKYRGISIDIQGDRIVLQGRKVVPLNRGKVPRILKRGGALSYFIRPLYQSLRRLRGSKRGRSKAPLLKVSVLAKTTYRILAEVLYTAGVADFRKVVLMPLTVGENRYGGRPVQRVPSRWRYGPVVTVAIEPWGFRISVKRYRRRAPWRISKVKGQYNQLGLSLKLAELRGKLRGKPLAVIKPNEDIPLEVLLATWDRVRTRCEPLAQSCERQVTLFSRIALEATVP